MIDAAKLDAAVRCMADMTARLDALVERRGGVRADEAPFKEGDHPRAEDGKFGSGGGGAKGSKGGSGEPSGVTGGAGGANHAAAVSAALSAKVKGGSAERVALRKLLKDAKDPDTKKKLTDKLIESFVTQHGAVKAKNPTKAAELEYKLSKLGFKFDKPATKVPATAPVAEHKAAAVEYSKEETENFKDLAQILGGEQGAKNLAMFAKKKLAESGLGDRLSPGEAAHIVAYTGAEYRETNASLRAGTMTVERWNHVKRLNDALDKLPPFVGETRRRVQFKESTLALYKQGMVVEERGFMSTSKKKDVWDGKIVFDVKSKTGRDVSMLSSSGGEAEVLFKSGTRFKVTSVTSVGSEHHIKLEEA